MNVLLTAHCLVTQFSINQCIRPHNWPEDKSNDLTDLTYDFIVVGSGSAGSVMANRLSEVPCWRVLLIEAGGDPPFISTIPAAAFTLQTSNIDWTYRSVNDSRACQGKVNGGCAFPRGKMLGGTSSINFMYYVRGNAADYDNIANNGNPGWEYKNVLNYFIKSENLTQLHRDKTRLLSQFHGHNGFLNVEPFSSYGTHPMVDPLRNAYEEVGIAKIRDYNGPSQHGNARLQGTIYNGRRVSTATAYLVPIRDRSNLVIWKNALVTKVLIENNIAVGVNVLLKNGRTVNATAKREVILSAGSINSAQILMLSGIGPKHHLEEKNINPVANLPVGENFHDHPYVPVIIGFKNYIKEPSLILSAIEYFRRRTGFFVTNGAAEVVAFVNTRNEYRRQPDIEFLHFYFDKGKSLIIEQFMRRNAFSEDIINFASRLNDKMPLLFVISTLIDVRSRGRILLNNTDPNTPPLIKPNFFSDNEDMETMLRGYDILNKMVKTKSFKKLGATLLPYKVPPCDDLKYLSRAYWICITLQIGDSVYHPMGSVKMGPRDDPSSVVDSSLKVKHVNRLRVIDSSIFPSQISGNTNAPTIMVAEKTADLIKFDHRAANTCQN